MRGPVRMGWITTKSHRNIVWDIFILPYSYFSLNLKIQDGRQQFSPISVTYSSKVCAARHVVDGSTPNHTKTLFWTWRGFLIHFLAQIQNPRWPPSTIFDFCDVLYSEVCAAQYIVDGSLPNHTQTLLRTCRGFLIHFLAQIQNPRWPPSTIFDFADVL